MNRRPTVMIVLLPLAWGAAGAIVNVAVAWALIWCNANQFVNWDLLTWDRDWPVAVPASWPAPASQAYRIDHAGVRVTVVYGGGKARSTEVLLWQAGFPCRSLAWHTRLEGSAVGRGAEMFQPIGSVWQDGIDLSRVPGHDVFPVWKRWPLRPLWPDFAINTVFHAAMLWLLFAAPFALRRRRRIQRGLCPKCAYPVGTCAKCTECGATVTPTGGHS